jgi:hypothetical protein
MRHRTAHDLSVVLVQVSKHRKNVTGTRLYEAEATEPVACRLWGVRGCHLWVDVADAGWR